MIRIRRWMICSVLSIASIVIFYRTAPAINDYRLEHSGPPPGPSSQSASGQFLRWKEHVAEYPPISLVSLPTGAPVPIPDVQFSFDGEKQPDEPSRQYRLQKIKEAFVHSWEGYKRHAWGKDEVAPLSGSGRNTLGGWGVTLVDALDTLWIMGMKEDFEQAVAEVATIDFTIVEKLPLNVFETTIRYLGGLLGAYDVSNGEYPVLLDKAIELGEVLYVAFDTPNRMPITRWSASKGSGPASALDKTLVAEIGSLSLEFTRLSQLSGDMKYYDAIQRITDTLDRQQNSTKLPGMWPTIVNARTGDFTGDTWFTLGGMADSVYEYLPKEYLMLGGTSDQYRNMYTYALQTIKSKILFRPMVQDDTQVLLAGNARANHPASIQFEAQTQHLTCFAGGMIALGARVFQEPEDIVVARKLVDGCIWAYDSMPTGIMPEDFRVVPCRGSATTPCNWKQTTWTSEVVLQNTQNDQELDLSIPYDERLRAKIERLRLPVSFSAIDDRRFMLRPEALESIFVLYRVTGEEKLRDAAWRMFKNIRAAARTDIAYAAIEDVTDIHSIKSDKMESFWMAETLKYLYLLYSPPDVVSLDDFVLNTEAHPFKRPSSF